MTTGGSAEDRLERMLDLRMAPGADRDAIDAQIWGLFGAVRAIIFTDLCAFSQSVADYGIISFLQTIQASHRLYIPIVDQYGGTVLKKEADSLLLVFDRAPAALDCAIAMNVATARFNRGRPPPDRMQLCVGIGYGPVLLLGDSDVFGAEVNAASLLGEDTAGAAEILVTEAVATEVGPRPDICFEPITFMPPGSTGALRAVYSLPV